MYDTAELLLDNEALTLHATDPLIAAFQLMAARALIDTFPANARITDDILQVSFVDNNTFNFSRNGHTDISETQNIQAQNDNHLIVGTWGWYGRDNPAEHVNDLGFMITLGDCVITGVRNPPWQTITFNEDGTFLEIRNGIIHWNSRARVPTLIFGTFELTGTTLLMVSNDVISIEQARLDGELISVSPYFSEVERIRKILVEIVDDRLILEELRENFSFSRIYKKTESDNLEMIMEALDVTR